MVQLPSKHLNSFRLCPPMMLRAYILSTSLYQCQRRICNFWAYSMDAHMQRTVEYQNVSIK